MGQGKRIARVAEVIRSVLAEAILNDMKDPRLGFITVMGVEVAPDLRDAKVMISVMGTEREKKGSIIALNHAKGYLQHIVSEELTMKVTPRLYFKLDTSIDESIKIDTVLKKIRDEEASDAGDHGSDDACDEDGSDV